MQYVEPAARTIIVGDGPLRDQLEKASQTYHLDGRVRFLGHREDVPNLMAACDLVVLPSAFEGLPNVLLEAMRLRKPVVATAAARRRLKPSSMDRQGCLSLSVIRLFWHVQFGTLSVIL